MNIHEGFTLSVLEICSANAYSDLLLLVCEDGDGEVGAGVSGFTRDDIGGDVAGARARRVLT